MHLPLLPITVANNRAVPIVLLATKFVAEFKECEVGHYVVHWRVKLLPGFNIPSGLRFTVSVSYGAESKDTSGSFDAALEFDELEKLGTEHPHDLGLDLKLDELLVIQPHEENAKATVILSLSNIESESPSEYFGLQVKFAEIKPFTGDNKGQTPEPQEDVKKHIVKRTAKSDFKEENAEGPRFWIVEPQEGFSAIPITRLAWSKDSSFLAALAVKKSSAHITVWDMGSIMELPEQMGDTSVLRPSFITVDVTPIPELIIPGDINKLSIGLAISPKGDQVMIYQEPGIGQWIDESRLPKCSFPIRLFKNPLVPFQDSTTVKVEENAPPQLVQQTIPHRSLDFFVGYGAFLMESKNVDWEMNDVHDATSSENTGLPTTGNMLFVACNGMYIDVFKIIPEKEWTHIRAIQLTDL
ncbi:hypothetical protein BGZ65_011185, partial [Modicella reniformis]